MSEKEEIEVKNWADDAAEVLLERKKKKYVCEGMWTPSGWFHIGNARAEIFTPYAVKHALEGKGEKVTQNFVTDDFDAVRKIPDGLGIKESEHEQYLGFPCATAPSPLPGFKNWKDAFVSQVKEVIDEFGVDLNIMSAYEMYKKGEFNELIDTTLDKSKQVVEIWNRIAGSDKSLDFVPLQVLCEECKKIYYTKVLAWDGKKVEYECKCGHKGKVSPHNGNAKLHWRVHWSAFWVKNEVDFESAGKDHFSKGGSVEVSQTCTKEIFNAVPPYQIPTEFIQLGKAKMAGSVGNVIDLKEWLSVASPELYRFLNFSYRASTVVEFDFRGNSFVLLNERFERARRIYYGKEHAQNEELDKAIARQYELSILGKPGKEMPQIVSYSFATLLGQMFDAKKEFGEVEALLLESKHIEKKMSKEEKEKAVEKILRAGHWVEKYAPEQFKVEFVEKAPAMELSSEVKEALGEIVDKLDKAKNAEDIQTIVFESAKSREIPLKEMFQTLYTALIGKNAGPKIGTLILAFGKEKVKKRLKEIGEGTGKVSEEKSEGNANAQTLKLNDKTSFTVNEKLFETFPQLEIGIVVVEGLKNGKENKEITKLVREAEKEVRGKIPSTEEISQNEVIEKWRKAYSSFGAKPSKYRSSVEALVRRAVQGNELPNINALVDLYNSFSLKYVTPLGGDDLDKVEGNIELKYASGKEEFEELGSKEKGTAREGEIIYADSKEVLCRRWNWRECDKTKLTEETKNAILYTENLVPEKTNSEEIVKELMEQVGKYLKAKVKGYVISSSGIKEVK